MAVGRLHAAEFLFKELGCMRAMVLTEHGGLDKLAMDADYPDPKARRRPGRD